MLYTVEDAESITHAFSKVTVLAKTREQAIKTVIRNTQFDGQEWFVKNVTASLAKSQKARVL